MRGDLAVRRLSETISRMARNPRPPRTAVEQFQAIQQLAGEMFNCAKYYAQARALEPRDDDESRDRLEAAEISMLVCARQLIEFFAGDSEREDAITRRDFPQVPRRSLDFTVLEGLKDDKKVLDQHLAHLSWGRYPMGPRWSGMHLPEILLTAMEAWADDVQRIDGGLASAFSPTLTWARTEIHGWDN